MCYLCECDSTLNMISDSPVYLCCRRYRFFNSGGVEEEMVTHSSILAYGSPWTEEPGRLQSMGSQDIVTKPPPETIKLLEENIHRTLFDIHISRMLLALSPKAKTTEAKINKWN